MKGGARSQDFLRRTPVRDGRLDEKAFRNRNRNTVEIQKWKNANHPENR